ncbi:MAG: hypothetical protein OHK0015_02160 [Chloroflexi bacterium OHK40]
MRPGQVTSFFVVAITLITFAFAAPRGSAPVRAQPAGLPARVAFIHAAPLAGDSLVTVALGSGPDVVVASRSFGGTLDYLDVGAGPLQVRFYAGALSADELAAATPLLDTSVTLEAGKDYTLAAAGAANGFPLEALLLPNTPGRPAVGAAELRVVHLAPFATGAGATAIDVIEEDLDAIPGLLNLRFGEASAFLTFPTGSPLDVRLVPSGQPGAAPLLNPPPLTLTDGESLTLFAIGGANGRELQLLPVTTPPRAQVALRIVHGAPFAEGSAAVNVLLNGTRVISNVVFGAVPTLQLDEGDYTLALELPGDPPTEVASARRLMVRERTYTALARGGASGAPVLLEIIEEPLPGGLPGESGLVVITHAAPFATGSASRVEVRDFRGQLVAPGPLTYGERVEIPLAPGTYDLRLTTVGGGQTLIDVPPFLLTPGAVVSVYATGDGENQPVGSVVFADAVRYTAHLPLVGR